MFGSMASPSKLLPSDVIIPIAIPLTMATTTEVGTIKANTHPREIANPQPGVSE